MLQYLLGIVFPFGEPVLVIIALIFYLLRFSKNVLEQQVRNLFSVRVESRIQISGSIWWESSYLCDDEEYLGLVVITTEGYTSLGTNRNLGDRTGLCIFITLPNCVGTPKTCQVWSLSEYTPTSIHGWGLRTIAESLLSAKVKLKLLWSNPVGVYKLFSRNQCTIAPRMKKKTNT